MQNISLVYCSEMNILHSFTVAASKEKRFQVTGCEKKIFYLVTSLGITTKYSSSAPGSSMSIDI